MIHYACSVLHKVNAKEKILKQTNYNIKLWIGGQSESTVI